ncbi:MAG: hypothetical protein R3F59_36620 [Myxococcota bacterium]
MARRLALPEAELYGRSLPLSRVVALSPVASNSVDLVEAVAGALAELDLDEQVELPAITLDHTVDELMSQVRQQLELARTLSA